MALCLSQPSDVQSVVEKVNGADGRHLAPFLDIIPILNQLIFIQQLHLRNSSFPKIHHMHELEPKENFHVDIESLDWRMLL